MNAVEIARICHEANRAYCLATGDYVAEPWEEAPNWQRASVIEEVEKALANPNLKPEESHQGWLHRKLEEGWSYGPVKDPEKKQHPCCLSYVELPEQHRVKDDLFLATIRVLSRK